MELTDGQHAALDVLRQHRTARLIGLAGTGKTWLALRLPELLGWTGPVGYAAPTHRAGTILAKKATDAGLDVRPLTVHSLIYIGRVEAKHCAPCHAERLLPPAVPCACASKVRRCRECGQFDKAALETSDVASHYDHLIIDEASMLEREDFHRLGEAASRCRNVVLVGDHGQLPPVSSPNWSALTSVDLPTAELTEIRRQAAGSPIIDAAHAIRKSGARRGLGLLPAMDADYRAYRVGERDADAVDRWVLGGGGPPVLGAGAIITNRNTDRVQRNNAARLALFGQASRRPVVEGEIIRSRFLAPGLTKDTLCQVTKVITQDERQTHADVVTEFGRHIPRQILVHADLRAETPNPRFGVPEPRWLYSYAMTAHAAQGSEFAKVAYHMRPTDSRELAYTAVTRAAEHVVVVTPGKVIGGVL